MGIPRCLICEKQIFVPNIVMAGGPLVEVCSDCLKYGKKVEVTEVDDLVCHCKLIGSIKIKTA